LTGPDLDILAVKLAEKLMFQPRWLKLKQAVLYANIGQKRLKALADDGEIVGYQDPDSKRGDWIFDKNSIDEYRLLPVRKTNLRLKKILDEIGR